MSVIIICIKFVWKILSQISLMYLIDVLIL